MSNDFSLASRYQADSVGGCRWYQASLERPTHPSGGRFPRSSWGLPNQSWLAVSEGSISCKFMPGLPVFLPHPMTFCQPPFPGRPWTQYLMTHLTNSLCWVKNCGVWEFTLSAADNFICLVSWVLTEALRILGQRRRPHIYVPMFSEFWDVPSCVVELLPTRPVREVPICACLHNTPVKSRGQQDLALAGCSYLLLCREH